LPANREESDPAVSWLRLEKPSADGRALSFHERFFNSNYPKYVFGINGFTDALLGQVNIDGLVDEFSSLSEYRGVPLVSLDEIPNNALVVNVVVIGKPLVAEKKLSQFGFEHLSYFNLLNTRTVNLPPVDYQEGAQSEIHTNLEKHQWLYKKLEDNTSRNQLQNILNFRLTKDLRFMRGFSAAEEFQYFEEFLKLAPTGEVFVDVGGYDGATTAEFIRRVDAYDQIYFFEPDAKNMALAKQLLSGHSDIKYFDLGLAEKSKKLKFDEAGAATRLGNRGSTTVQVRALDEVIGSPVSFIKMDIEGGEALALRGATRTISRYHPRLAIAGYHKPSDLWEISELILSIREDYSVYLRHYTEGISETVLFFIPK
jgi:FkbM family methyltransferase